MIKKTFVAEPGLIPGCLCFLFIFLNFAPSINYVEPVELFWPLIRMHHRSLNEEVFWSRPTWRTPRVRLKAHWRDSTLFLAWKQASCRRSSGMWLINGRIDYSESVKLSENRQTKGSFHTYINPHAPCLFVFNCIRVRLSDCSNLKCILYIH